MDESKYNKLILAVLHGEDYDSVVGQLNKNGFSVTVLNSVGGFLRRKSVTVMIGLPESRLSEALSIFENEYSQRTETIYQSAMLPPGGMMASSPSIPVQTVFGGVKVFVLDLDRMVSY